MYTETDFTCFNIGIAPRYLRPGQGPGRVEAQREGGVVGGTYSTSVSAGGHLSGVRSVIGLKPG